MTARAGHQSHQAGLLSELVMWRTILDWWSEGRYWTGEVKDNTVEWWSEHHVITSTGFLKSWAFLSDWVVKCETRQRLARMWELDEQSDLTWPKDLHHGAGWASGPANPRWSWGYRGPGGAGGLPATLQVSMEVGKTGLIS